MEEFFERNCIRGYHIKKYGRRRLESCWYAKEIPKTLPIDKLWLWKRNYHRTFASKGIAGVFAVFVTGRCYRMYSKSAQEILSWPGTRRTWSSLLSSFQGNAYGTCRFRKPVAWSKVENMNQLQSRKCERRARARGMARTILNSHRNVSIIRCRKNSLQKMFREINFRSLTRLRKFRTTKIFRFTVSFTIFIIFCVWLTNQVPCRIIDEL